MVLHLGGWVWTPCAPLLGEKKSKAPFLVEGVWKQQDGKYGTVRYYWGLLGVRQRVICFAFLATFCTLGFPNWHIWCVSAPMIRIKCTVMIQMHLVINVAASSVLGWKIWSWRWSCSGNLCILFLTSWSSYRSNHQFIFLRSNSSSCGISKWCAITNVCTINSNAMI